MICDKCKSENTEYKTTRRNDRFLTLVICKDCGNERLPTNEERSAFND